MIPPLLPETHPMLHAEMPLFDFTGGDAKVYASAIANTLIDCMEQYGGVGLSANQVGIEVRAFVILLSGRPVVMFNPIITWVSIETVQLDEGCISFEGLWLKIKRPKECQVSYTTVDQERKVVDLVGWEARTAMHELDHLDGVDFTQIVSRLRFHMADKKRKKILSKKA